MIPDKVKRVLDENNLQAVEFEEGSTPTALSAAMKFGVEVGQIAKSILFLGKDGRFFLVVCPGDRKISGSKLKRVVGVKSRMANSDETLRETDFLPGGVCPFGIHGIEIYLDENLKEYDTIYPAAGTNSSGVPMTFGQLSEITGGQVCDLTIPFET
jgi:prolyl-tRNA editing enzyme YbaK/EbsC (Cys-tRNA(Pro) deacylase)